MTLAVTGNSARRIGLVAGLGIALALALTVLALGYANGWAFTFSWLMGAQNPYPQNFQIGSGWWAVFGLGVWCAAQLMLWLRGARGLRFLGFVLGPLAAAWVFVTWTVSFVLYGFRVWSVGGTPSGIRYVLDGPIMNGWHKFAGWVLSSVGLPSAVPPVDFVNGSSVHTHGTVIVLGIANEAILACVLGTLLVMSAYLAFGFRHSRRRAA